ncbi:hypothetical protein HDU92_002237 [Lobulomyces angularis]|nr:hypothetical protein HDU92_002237 [Lobulomyces angularis]
MEFGFDIYPPIASGNDEKLYKEFYAAVVEASENDAENVMICSDQIVFKSASVAACLPKNGLHFRRFSALLPLDPLQKKTSERYVFGVLHIAKAVFGNNRLHYFDDRFPSKKIRMYNTEDLLDVTLNLNTPPIF